MRWRSIGIAVVALAASACAAASPANTPAPTDTPAAAASKITPLLATTQLRVGTQRVAFLLDSTTALVTAPEVEIRTSLAGTSLGETAVAPFYLWPFGTRGTYSTELTFDRPGTWRLDIHVDDGTFAGDASLLLDVAERSSVVDVGELAPFSNTKTLRSEDGDLSRLTTSSRPDPELYRMTVAEALISGRPSLIVFASPAFCTSPTCGPQVETVSELRALHPDEADFVHVEVYDNPHEIQGDLSRATYAPALAAWGIDAVPGYLNESWVFVLGSDGRIEARFEGYASLRELEAALLAAS
ncbi:MAG: thioredoxin family protein [Chloroflexi bacterium]|nr:thioredoxin family protein [Chloroflexota bacterium]